MSREEIKEMAWKKMEAILEKELPKKKRRYFLLLPYGIAASLLITAGYIAFFNSNNQLPIVESNPIQIQNIHSSKNLPYLQSSSQTNTSTKSVSYLKDAPLLNQPYEEETTTGLFIFEDGNQISKLITETKSLFNNEELIVMNEERLFSELSAKEYAVMEKAPRSQQKEDVTPQAFEKTPTALVSNQQENQVFMLTPDIKRSFQPQKDMGVKTNGSIGLVSDDFEEYGMRLGLEIQKPITKNVNLNSGVRYSIYKEEYGSTYNTSTGQSLTDNFIVDRLTERNVNRSFVEIPVYANYEVTPEFTVKGGASLTYNKNKSEAPGFSRIAVANNTSFTQEEKQEIGRLYQDQSGYLGEYLVGASLNVEKITFDLEATRGFINNQGIENRNVVGMRISYKFGQ